MSAARHCRPVSGPCRPTARGQRWPMVARLLLITRLLHEYRMSFVWDGGAWGALAACNRDVSYTFHWVMSQFHWVMSPSRFRIAMVMLFWLSKCLLECSPSPPLSTLLRCSSDPDLRSRFSSSSRRCRRCRYFQVDLFIRI